MNSPQPTIRSGHKIPLLDGTNDHLVFSREHWNMIIMAANAFLASPNWTVTDHGVILDVGGAGGKSWIWQTPNKELDSTVDVPGPSGNIYTAVYISPMNPLCTTGLIDLVTGELTKAVSGWYMAAKPVPAAVGGAYNVPCPLPQSVPTGTPLKGDADSATIFWIPMGAVLQCSV